MWILSGIGGLLLVVGLLFSFATPIFAVAFLLLLVPVAVVLVTYQRESSHQAPSKAPAGDESARQPAEAGPPGDAPATSGEAHDSWHN